MDADHQPEGTFAHLNPVQNHRSPVGWRLSIFLGFLAFAWRLLPALRTPVYIGDEPLFGLPTIDAIKAGLWPLHYVGAPYGFPLAEYFAALGEILTGRHPMWIRLPNIALGSVAVVMLFRLSAPFLGSRVAFATGLLLACPNSLHLHFISMGSSYGFGLLCVAVLWQTWQPLSGREPLSRYAWVGVVTGIALFIFPQVRVPLLGWIVVLLGPHLVRLARRRKAVAIGASFCTAALLPLGYYFISRKSPYTPPLWGVVLFGLGAVGALTIAGIVMWFDRSWRAWTRRLLVTALLAAVVVALPEWVYQHSQSSHLEQKRRHDPTRYTLRHPHELPRQGAFFLGEVVPLVVLGNADALSPTLVEEARIETGWVIVGLAAVAAWLWSACSEMKRTSPGIRRQEKAWLLVPVLTTAIVLIPSWNLADNINARYFTLTMPGTLLPFVWACDRHLPRHLATVSLYLYVAWCAYDSWVLWPQIWIS